MFHPLLGAKETTSSKGLKQLKLGVFFKLGSTSGCWRFGGFHFPQAIGIHLPLAAGHRFNASTAFSREKGCNFISSEGKMQVLDLMFG